MVVEIVMPKLGLNMLEGTLVRWLVQDGAPIQRGQSLFEVETDKVTTEVEAETDGLLHHDVPEGSVVPVSAVVGLILQPGEEPATGSSAPAASVAAAESAPTSERAAKPESTAAPVRVNAAPAAKRRAQELQVDIAQIPGSGKDGRISLEDVEAFVAAQKSEPEPASSPHVSPLARRIAQEKNIDLATVTGSGLDGRILRKDVEQRVTAVPDQTTESLAVVPVKGVRAVIFERMYASAQQTAPVTLTTEVDATALVQFRAQLNAQFGQAGELRVSYNALLVKLTGIALRELPYMNARLQDGSIQNLADIHIGVAVDSPKGLLVPVVHNAAKLPLTDIDRDLRESAERALAGRSTRDDFEGGTFTITNLGAYGIDAFTPIINLPEIAIIGVGRIIEKPVAYLGGIHLRQRMALSLTFDHRLVDGAPAARFLQRVRQLIEAVSLESMLG